MASMKLVLSFVGVFLAVYVCQFTALDYDDEEAAIMAELDDAPLEDADLEDIFDDSDEIGARSAKDILKKLKEKCVCEGLMCGCCAEPKIAGIKFSTCLNLTMFPNDKIIEFGIGVGDQAMKKNVSVGKLERVCDRLPGYLKKVKLCLYNTWTESEDEKSMAACTSIDTIVFNSTVATIKFQCLELKDNKVEFINHPDIDRSAIMSLKIKNPIKSLIKLFKKKKDETA